LLLFEMQGNAGVVQFEMLKAGTVDHGVGTKPLDHRFAQHELECAAMDEALFMLVADMLAAFLAEYLLPVAGVEDRLGCLDGDFPESLQEAQLRDFLGAVDLDVDADAKRLQVWHAFVNPGAKAF